MRVRVVDQETLLFLSQAVLKALGAVMNLGEGCVDVLSLCTRVPLRESKAGHVSSKPMGGMSAHISSVRKDQEGRVCSNSGEPLQGVGGGTEGASAAWTG